MKLLAVNLWVAMCVLYRYVSIAGVIYTMICFIILILIGSHTNCRLNKVLPSSMAIYCTHMIFYDYIYAIIRRIVPNEFPYNIVGWLMSAFIAIILVSISYIIIKKMKLGYVLYGARKNEL